MAKLPPQVAPCPTLEAVDRALVAREADQPARRYLGVSYVGLPCKRQAWYRFRLALEPGAGLSADSLRKIQDGHHGEAIMAERLRMVEGIQLFTHDPETGGQIAVEALNGYLQGHVDGVIKGLIQTPKTPHVWEHKQVNEKRFRDLKRKREEHGDKQALAAWDVTYYVQAQLYMHLLGIDRHYLTVATPGGREYQAIRTELSIPDADAALELAREILESPEPPLRVSEDSEFYLCRFCEFSDICHGHKLPQVHCRTCTHATPAPAGWYCERHGDAIPESVEPVGCSEHRYLPPLLQRHGDLTDASEAENWAEYGEFRNGGPGGLSSRELRATAETGPIMHDENIQALREQFQARVVSTEIYNLGHEFLSENELAVCSACELSEGSLTTHCCKERVNFEKSEEIYKGNLDYKDGKWVSETSPHSPAIDIP